MVNFGPIYSLGNMFNYHHFTIAVGLVLLNNGIRTTEHIVNFIINDRLKDCFINLKFLEYQLYMILELYSLFETTVSLEMQVSQGITRVKDLTTPLSLTPNTFCVSL